MRNFFLRFFKGRYGSYGTDALTRFLIAIAVTLLLISICTPLGFLYYISFVLLIVCYYRLFSKKITVRYHENEIYLKYRNKFLGIFKNLKGRIQQKKDYHIYKCPSCGQKIRVPRGKGKIMVTCPVCRHEFMKKS